MSVHITRLAYSLITATLAVLVAAACQYIPAATSKPTPPPLRVIDFGAADFTFALPDTIPSGLITLRMTNHGNEPHHGQVLRLNDGVSLEAFMEALSHGDFGDVAPLISMEGGPGAIDPHRTSEVMLDLRPGTYVMVCFIPGADGLPHLAKGMLKPFVVTPSEAPATLPATAGVINLQDFSFDMPNSVVAGRSVFQVANRGPQPHELVVAKLGPSTSLDDIKAFFENPSGPPPFQLVGGINGLAAGKSGFVALDLEPGRYAAICMIPDPASQQPHIHLGMARVFTVRG